MRTSRLVAGFVTAGLVGLAPVAISAPANAVPIGSVTTLDVDPPSLGAANFEVGDSLYFGGGVKGSDGTSTPTVGAATLQVYTPSNPVWTPVSTDTSASSLFFPDVKAISNAQYKVVFAGGTSGVGSSAKEYGASESAPVAVSVTRSVKLSTKGLKVSGKVTPDYGKKKVKILAKSGKKFKKLASVKTKKNGKFTFTAPRRNKLLFVIVIPGDANYAALPAAVYKVNIF